MLNSERDDEVCDARDDDSSTAAGITINFLPVKISFPQNGVAKLSLL